MNELTENQLAAMEIYAGWKDARGDFESEDPNELAEIASAGLNTVIHLGGLVEQLQQQLATAREALAEMTADRDSWCEQAAARVNDWHEARQALQAAEADAARYIALCAATERNWTLHNDAPGGGVYQYVGKRDIDRAIDATLQRDRQP